MDLSKQHWEGTELFDAAYLDLAQALIAEGRIDAVRDLMLVAAQHPQLWASEAGTTLLEDLIALLRDGLAEGHVADVVPALAVCPPDLAMAAIDLLLDAFFPEGVEVDLHRLDDATLLCLALLVGSTGRRDQAIALLEKSLGHRHSDVFTISAPMVRNHLRLGL